MVGGKYLENEIFPGQGKVGEFCGWPVKFRKNWESEGKVREFENKWLWQAVFRKVIYSVQEPPYQTMMREMGLDYLIRKYIISPLIA